MLTILGSTGTIGRNTLSVIDMLGKTNSIFALTAEKNYKLLFTQIKKYKPLFAVILNEVDADILNNLCKKDKLKTKILFGKDNYSFVAKHSKCKSVLSAIVGAAALEPTFAAVLAGKRILLANKESIIMSGNLLVKQAKKSGAILIPVDSEHNAILQIITSLGFDFNNKKKSNYIKNIQEITLTASGGPFLNYSKKQLLRVTPKQAVKHPTWKMGKKISVDSATMMNKGLEVIEASILFGLKPNQVNILIHPQSIVHAMIAFKDGSVISHMSSHDMRIAISYALSWPDRYKLNMNIIKQPNLKNLTFSRIKKNQFKCLDLCIKALNIGQNAPTILNAANEVAVEKFLENKIKFLDIPVIIDKALRSIPVTKNSTLKSILASDKLTREYVIKYIDKKWK